MKVINAKYKWLLEGDLRIDASYHLSEGRVAKMIIDSCPTGKIYLKYCTNKIFYGGRAKRFYVDKGENGIPFMSSSDMLKSDFNSLKYISKKLTKNIESFYLEQGWTLVSRSGTIGNTVYVNENFKGKAASEHIIRVVPNKKIKSGYLYAFLTSKFGYALLTQGTFGAVIQHIEPDFMESIPIPLLPVEEKIHDLIIDASNLRVEANRLLNIADKEIYDNLNINEEKLKQYTSPFEKDTAFAFTINKKELSHLTLRARNYSLRLRKIKESIENNEYSKLKDVIETGLDRGGRFKRIEVNSNSKNAVEMLNQGDIFNLCPKGKTISKKPIKNWESEITQKNMILIPALGTLGENEIFSRAKFCWGFLEGKTVAEGLMRVIPDTNKIDAAYLFAILNSKLWFRILRSLVYGTNLLGYIYPLVEEMPIPRFEKKVEENIGNKVRMAYSNYTEALRVETQAIKIIENEISSWQK